MYINYRDKMYGAASSGDTKTVMAILDKNINGIDELKESAIFVASYLGQTDTVKALLDMGIDINIRNAFTRAAFSGHIETVKLFIDRGVNLNLQNDDALKYATLHKHTEVVNLLLVDYKMKPLQTTVEWLNFNKDTDERCANTLKTLDSIELQEKLQKKLSPKNAPKQSMKMKI